MKTLLLPLGIICFSLTIAAASAAEKQSSPHVCRDRPCSEPVTKLKVGKFSFSANLYDEKPFGGGRIDCKDNYCQFDLKFGVPGKMINLRSPDGNESYRIINGPLPARLMCPDSMPTSFADLPHLPLGPKSSRRIGHRAYYNNPPNQTFSFFSKRPTSIGVFIAMWGATGTGVSTIYVFDTETGKMFKIEAGTCGLDVDFIRNPEGVVSGYVRWERRYYFGTYNFAAIYVDWPASYKDIDGQDLSLAGYMISNASSVVPTIFQSIYVYPETLIKRIFQFD